MRHTKLNSEIFSELKFRALVTFLFIYSNILICKAHVSPVLLPNNVIVPRLIVQDMQNLSVAYL